MKKRRFFFWVSTIREVIWPSPGTLIPALFFNPSFFHPIERWVKKKGWDEGIGTRPDYFANRADQKNEGPRGEFFGKLGRKSEN